MQQKKSPEIEVITHGNMQQFNINNYNYNNTYMLNFATAFVLHACCFCIFSLQLLLYLHKKILSALKLLKMPQNICSKVQ